MNKKVLFFALTISFYVCAYWPEDFSFSVDGGMNYSCQRHSLMSQLSQEYKDNDCMTDEEVRKMAGLESVAADSADLVVEVTKEELVEADVLADAADKAVLSSMLVKHEQDVQELKRIFIKALIKAYLLKYHGMHQNRQKDEIDSEEL